MGGYRDTLGSELVRGCGRGFGPHGHGAGHSRNRARDRGRRQSLSGPQLQVAVQAEF